MHDSPADLVEIPSPQLSRLRHLDEQLRAQEISELRGTGSPAGASSSGVYVPWLVVGHEVRTSNAASTLTPVMVGRDREFAQLQGAWRTGGQMLVIRGQAGIGKSRLVREFANWVRDAGGTVLAGRCSPTAGGRAVPSAAGGTARCRPCRTGAIVAPCGIPAGPGVAGSRVVRRACRGF